jgi:hypothetical protein
VNRNVSKEVRKKILRIAVSFVLGSNEQVAIQPGNVTEKTGVSIFFVFFHSTWSNKDPGN